MTQMTPAKAYRIAKVVIDVIRLAKWVWTTQPQGETVELEQQRGKLAEMIIAFDSIKPGDD